MREGASDTLISGLYKRELFIALGAQRRGILISASRDALPWGTDRYRSLSPSSLTKISSKSKILIDYFFFLHHFMFEEDW